MEVTPELAELFGIYVGDGTMSTNNIGRGALLSIAAGVNEKEWLEHVANLFEQIFRYRPKVRWNSNVYKIQTGVSKICEFFKRAGFPAGKKASTVRAPKAVMETRNHVIYKAFLRGYFDADGCLCFERNLHGRYVEYKKTYHYYPRILLTSISRDLIVTDIKQMLKLIGLQHNTRERMPGKKEKHKSYVATITGAAQLELWMKEIRSSNPVHITKYQVWKKFGFCPTKTTLEQRLAMLSDELNPEILVKK
ncbi:MAG: hypothetical protein OEX16_05395 [Hadesarchaea archaeon]|nr:hypothetical protein [Hadesarchaea archaeon]MDH5685768.1 hypothetical protein [Hadesarchaea archaeon]